MNDHQLASVDLMGDALDWQASRKTIARSASIFWSSQLGLPCA